ncbi:hypothetical protein BJ546DRAFT_33028 [Cryomyces antarcticus]
MDDMLCDLAVLLIDRSLVLCSHLRLPSILVLLPGSRLPRSFFAVKLCPSSSNIVCAIPAGPGSVTLLVIIFLSWPESILPGLIVQRLAQFYTPRHGRKVTVLLPMPPPHHHSVPTCPLPPWEQISITQVPYLPSVPTFSASEKQALPWASAARSNEARSLPSRKSSSTSDVGIISPVRSLSTTRSSLSQPRRSLQSVSHAAPAVSGTAASPSPLSLPKKNKQRSRSTSGAASGQVDSFVRAQRRQGTDQWCDGEKIASSRPLPHRFKTALKDIFKKDPIDESKFEDIDNKHWTEL